MKPYRSNTSRKFPFTKKAIEALPAHDPASPSREMEYADIECIGLHLRVSKNGRRFFQHRYRYLGRKMCLSLGEFPAVSVQDARSRVAEHKALLARDKDPAAERGKVRADLTFEEFSTQHYLPHAKAHKQTWDDDKNQIERRLNPILGKLRLQAITPRDVAMVHSKEKERTTACTANHLLATLKRMLNLAVKWGLLEKNPAGGQEKFKEGPLRERYLSKEELPKFLKALEDQDDLLSVAALRMLLYTGCRREEIMSLRWENVRLDEERIFLPKTKNGRSRTVHLNARAKEVIQDLQARKDQEDRTRGSEYVFPSRQGTKKGYIYDLRKPFEKACLNAGIDNFRIHDLRHTFASMAVSSGADLYAVQRLLGHQDIAMTQRYAHLNADDLKKATEGVSEMFDRAA
ncbi:tyrosine-type recombinase/integrase [Pelobacter propionicus]|uniref:Phage integrase family protein n=1 Tax=Pelobacter propionicus (strain DSM 2379 / NBRC 103807 / OttBd1) TaxID=338966 RepID=A1AUY6_PELPD|nr:site-specific integrase [Pelobacter propionicus]ABL01157.1 phage integrase family protein [Pelobacter propionicus DSM 2379]